MYKHAYISVTKDKLLRISENIISEKIAFLTFFSLESQKIVIRMNDFRKFFPIMNKEMNPNTRIW